jgi:hypothetical protein
MDLGVAFSSLFKLFFANLIVDSKKLKKPSPMSREGRQSSEMLQIQLWRFLSQQFRIKTKL